MKVPILFIHGITKIGGAERELLAILEHLPRLGYSPVVVCPDSGPLGEELARLDIDMRHVPMPPWRKVFAYPRRTLAIRRLHEVIADIQPGLIHVNDIWWVPQSLRATLGSDIPILAHVRQEIEPAKVRRYGLDRVDLVLAISHHVRQSLEAGGVQGEGLVTLYSGLDMTRVPQREDGHESRRHFDIPVDVPLIGTVANLFPRKGYEVMLRAMPAVLAAYPNVHYVIIGHGDAGYERNLRSLVGTLGVERAVHFVGFQEEVYSCLAAIDVYVHPAIMEGFGIALLEAMAMEKPVVASRVGGVPEVVEEEVTGLLVPPGDPEALTLALVRLLKEPYTCQRMGRAGKQRVEARFSLEQTMGNLQSMYTKLLAPRNGLWPLRNSTREKMRLN
jgi:glycosyltransferase involved in cell wall biosynthesis